MKAGLAGELMTVAALSSGSGFGVQAVIMMQRPASQVHDMPVLVF